MKKLLFLLTLLLANTLFSQESILLNSPADGDTIYTHHPLLTWSIWGGLPVNNEREYYQITVVQLQAEQDAASGVMVNTPLVHMDHLAQNQLFYPYDAPELQEGKRYGWQVQKIMNNAVVYSSEAWEFILGIPPITAPVYYKMKHVHDGAVCESVNGKFYFEFTEAYNAEDLKFKLLDAENNSINAQAKYNQVDGELAQENNVKRTGFNQYELNFGTSVQTGIYRLIVWDAKYRKYELTFSVN